MQPRYALRFENGERRGESVPVTGSGITIGRKPGNSVQILDASVSGRHAEFLMEGDRLLMRDLGSTNGSRVGGERVSERALQHGDQVMLGNVRLTLLDTGREAPPPEADDVAMVAGASQASSVENTSAGDSVRTISADKVSKSASRSLVGAIGLVLALGAAYGAWWYLKTTKNDTGESVVRAVEPVVGDLLRGPYSFEGDGAAWENDQDGPAAFDVDSAARRSGAVGLSAPVTNGQWALARSGAVQVGSNGALAVVAHVRVDGGASARVGLELETSNGSSARTVIWSAPTTAVDFEKLELNATVPECFDVARVVVLARAGTSEGSVDIDDVAMVSGTAQAADAIEEFRFFVHGEPGNVATLFKIDRTLLSDLHVRSGDGGVGDRSILSTAKLDHGFDVRASAGGRAWSFRVDEPLLKGGLASTGSGGYRSHTGEFTREGCTAVVAGAGKDQVRLVLPAAMTLRGRVEGLGLRLELDGAQLSSLLVQTDFRAERDEAQSLARTARETEKAGQLGAAAALWSRVRDEFPFESALLAEAETARARIAEAGLADIRNLRIEVERARFFRLVDLYRQCRRSAEAVATRFAGIEIETDARGLVGEIDADLSLLEVDLQRAERTRLLGIVAALDSEGSTALAGHVRKYLEQHFAGVSDARSGGR